MWQSTWQFGKETTEGTSVAATRKVYYTGSAERKRNEHIVEVETGTRSQARDLKLRTIEATAKLAAPLDSSEIIELLLAALRGGVTGSQEASTGHYTWTFVNAETSAHVLDPQTVEWFDGQRGWELNGAKINELKLSGTITGDAMVEAEYWGRDLVQATITGSLTDRVPSYFQGWEAALYADTFGGTAGSTIKASTLISWAVTIRNNLTRKYFGDNTAAAGAILLGKCEVLSEFVFEANAIGYAEWQNWDAATKRLMRLKLGNNGAVIGTSTTKPTLTIDLPGAWKEPDITGEDQGTRTYKLTNHGIYDPTNAELIKVIADNARSAAYA